MCLEIYGLDPADFRSAPTWKGALKNKTKTRYQRWNIWSKKYIKNDNEKNILKMLTIGT